MKTLKVASFLICLGLGPLALASTGEQVCASLSFQNEREDCLAYINDKYIDGLAADLCLDLSFKSNRMDCLRASADKVYTQGQMQICRDSSFDSGKIECLQRVGLPTRSDTAARRRLEAIRRLSDDALLYMDEGRYERARLIMERIVRMSN